jgi:Rps23 Pro-64 3,4-dihydroxylase Tpa1-like proline 4-hydroxylase
MTTDESNALIDNISNALAEHCPLVFADVAALTLVAGRIKSYTETLDRWPAIEMVLAWAGPLEQGFQQEADEAAARQQAEQERIEARKRAREDYLSGSDADKAQAVREFRERNRPQEHQAAFVPDREYSQAEQDRMSSDEYAVKVLGRNRIEDRNSSSAGPLPCEKARQEITRKRVMRSRKSNGTSADRHMRASLRRQIREGLQK